MKPPFSRVPALPVVIGWMAGIVVFTWHIDWWLPAVATVVGICLMAARRHYPALMFYGVALGWLGTYWSTPSEMPDICETGHEIAVCGVVKDVGRSHVVMKVDSIGAAISCLQPGGPFNIYLYFKPERAEAQLGDRHALVVTPEKAESRLSFPHDIDYGFMYQRLGVSVKAYIETLPTVARGREVGISSWFYARQREVIKLLSDTELTDSTFGLLSAILVGQDDDLQTSMRENFRAVGIAHALALSGFHVGAIVLLISILLFPLRALSYRNWLRYALMIVAIWLYAGLTGMPTSVLRAVIMLTIFLLSRIIGGEPNTYNSVCLAMVIIMAIWPYSLFTAGLQLSVCAVLGIVTFSEPLNPIDPKRHRLHTAVAVAIVPLAALLGTLPVTIAWFHRMPVYFIMSNLLVSAVFPILMFGGVLLLLCSLCGIGTWWLSWWLNHFTDWLDSAVSWMAGLPYVEIDSLYLSVAQLIALSLAIVMLGIAVHWRHRMGWGAFGFLFCVFGITMVACDESLPESEAFVIDMPGNTPFVFRYGDKMIVSTTCRHADREAAVHNIAERLHNYIESRRVREVRFTNGDFVLGPYSRKGDIINCRNVTVALIWRPGKLDQIAKKVDYALLCSRYRRTVAEVEAACSPDTIVLSHDLSPRRRAVLKTTATRPVISL